MRFRELDGLRGIAALAVVLAHFTGAYNSRYVDDPPASVDIWWGKFGVDLFFMISGFVVLLSARRAKRPSDFVISRVSRLYPPYWLSIGLAIALALIFSIPRVPLDTTTILSNLTMVQRWFLQPNIDDVYWTLAVEMQFYCLLFVLILITRCNVTDRVVVWASSIWLVVTVVVAVIASPAAQGIDPQLVETPMKILINATLAEYGPLFCFGMLLYISRDRGKLMPLALVAGAVGIINTGLISSWANAIWVGALVVIFFVVTQRRETKALKIAPIQWLGKVSYSLYLTHSFVGFVVIHWSWPYAGRDGAIVLAILVSLVVAWGMQKFAEQLLGRLVRGGLVRLQRPRKSPAQLPGAVSPKGSHE